MDYDYELFLGGAPKGFYFLGEADRSYVQSFYSHQCQDRLKFLVQIRQLGGRKYCCYNYLLYEGVLDSEDRKGSYFGLTLRLDMYCKDIHSIYGLLDILYRQYVHGNLLVNVSDVSGKSKYLKYTVPNFEAQSGLHKQMETAAGQLLGTMIRPESFVSFDGYPQMGANYVQVHLHDFDNAGLDALVRRDGGVAMSPYYDGRRIVDLTQNHNATLQSQKQGYDKQINDINIAHNDKIKNLNAQLDMSQKDKDKLNNEIKTKNQTIEDYKQQVERLEDTNKKLQQVEDISTLVARIEEPIKKLVKLEKETADLRKDTADSLEKLVSAMSKLSKQEKPDKYNKRHEDDEGGKRPRIRWRFPHGVTPWLVLAAFLLVLVLCCLGLGKCSSGAPWQDSFKATSQGQMKTTASHVNNHGGDEHADEQDQSEDNEEQSSAPPETPAVQTSGQIRIDIGGYSGEGALKKDRLYPVELKGVNALGGKWKVEGANIKGDINSSKIEITPNDTIVKIAFTAADGTEIQPRDLKAE